MTDTCFLADGAAVSLSIPLAAISLSVPAGEVETAKPDPNNRLAESLAHTHDAANSARTSGTESCRTCLHFQGGSKDAWSGCNIFSDNLVNANGWCNAHAKPE